MIHCKYYLSLATLGAQTIERGFYSVFQGGSLLSSVDEWCTIPVLAKTQFVPSNVHRNRGINNLFSLCPDLLVHDFIAVT